MSSTPTPTRSCARSKDGRNFEFCACAVFANLEIRGQMQMKQYEERAAKWLAGVVGKKFQDGSAREFDGFRSDWELKIGPVIVVLEVERDQNHPPTNILKNFCRLDKKNQLRILLIHYFITSGRASKGARKQLADRLVKLLTGLPIARKRFRYIEVHQDRSSSMVNEIHRCLKELSAY